MPEIDADFLQKQIDKLQTQLTEKDREIQDLRTKNISIEDLNKQFAKKIEDYEREIEDYEREMDCLTEHLQNDENKKPKNSTFFGCVPELNLNAFKMDKTQISPDLAASTNTS